MKRKLSEAHLAKLKKGREANLNKRRGLILSMGEGLEIFADRYQYILILDGIAEGYYPSLDMAIEDMLNVKLKEYLIASERKDIEGVLQSLKNFQLWVEELLKPLDTQGLVSNIITNHNAETL